MRFFHLLAFLYPASFRAEYGREIASIFSVRRRNASGFFSITFLWMETLIDVIVTALQAHWDILRQDVVFALRTLSRSKGFAATAILVAALGVGATTAAYTITDYVVIRPLPFPESGRLVKLWENLQPGGYREMEASPANYRDWKLMSRSFSAMAASRPLSVGLVGVGDPQQIEGACVTSDLLPMLGIQPLLGRLFAPQEDRSGASGTVILSYGLWRESFGGDPSILGKRILLDGAPYDVIGVMPGGFAYPRREARLWTAMRFAPDEFEDRNDNYLDVIAKLRPGISIERARAEMLILSKRLRHEYPKDNEHVGVTINALRDEISNRSRMMVFALLGASFCVLLIACTNLANLLLARALVRRKEVAVRSALGAGRERLVRQMLTESLLLAIVGGGFGVGCASLAAPLFAKLVPDSLPIGAVPSIDGRVLAFAFLLTVLTGVCFGVLPAARAAGAANAAGLQEGSRQGVGGRKERLRSALVVAEIAFSVVLLVCCGLLVRTLSQLRETDPGFRPDHVLTLRTVLPMPKYQSTALRVQFYRHVLSEVRNLPGVKTAGYASFLPMVARGGIWPVTLPGWPPNQDRAFHQASLRFVTPGYFAAMGIPLLQGRDVAESDTAKTRYAAVVSASFVREYWPNENPIGRSFDIGFAARTVVGVVGDVRVRGFEHSSEPQVYLSYQQVPDNYLVWYAPKDLAIHAASFEGLLPAVRRIIAEADSQQPISDVQTLSGIVDDETADRRLQADVLAGFAFVAIVLSAIGIHGLLSFTVSERRQEIGVRVAVGASPADILKMIFGESSLLVAVGTVLGVALAYLAGRTLQALLAGVHPGDLPSFAAGIGLIVCAGFAGSLLPALKAVRVDPVNAMRSE